MTYLENAIPPSGEETSPAHSEEIGSDIMDSLERILDLLGFSFKLDLELEDDHCFVNLDGQDREYLLEKKGEGINSLQFIFNKVYNYKKTDQDRIKITLDSNGYRKNRETELREIGLRSADKVKQFGNECILTPLNPYERRIIHLALQDDPEVETISHGDGFLKCITICMTRK